MAFFFKFVFNTTFLVWPSQVQSLYIYFDNVFILPTRPSQGIQAVGTWQKLQLFYHGILGNGGKSLISLHTQIAHHYHLQYFSWTVSFHHRLIFQRHFFLCLLRQENWQLAAGLLSCANHLYLPVLPGCDMAGAKDNGQEATAQPQSCSDSLQLPHGWPVSIYVLWGTASQPPLKFENVCFSIFIS